MMMKSIIYGVAFDMVILPLEFTPGGGGGTP